MIIRGLAGVMIGVLYGCLVTGVMFLVTHIGLENKPSSLILLNPAAMAWFVTVLSGLIAGTCAVLVGLVVGLGRIGKAKAATTGFLTGLLVLGLLSINSHLPTTLRGWIEFFAAIVSLPIGLTLIGLIVAIIAERLYRHEL